MKGEYPRFKDIYSRDALIEHFYLAESERALINDLRGSQNRLGAAILLKSLLYLGYFPDGFNRVPASVRAYIAEQLQVPNSVAEYAWNSGTRDAHISLIRNSTGSSFLTASRKAELEDWLRDEATKTVHTHEDLFEIALGRLFILNVEPTSSSMGIPRLRCILTTMICPEEQVLLI